MAWLSQDRPSGEPDPRGARGFHQGQHVRERAQDQGGNAGQLEGSCDQSHGLAAERSDRDEQGRIHRCGMEPSRDLGAVAARQDERAGDESAEAVVDRREGADLACLHELSQSIEREDDVRILPRERVVVVVGSEGEARQGSVGPDLPEAGIAPRERGSEGLMIPRR